MPKSEASLTIRERLGRTIASLPWCFNITLGAPTTAPQAERCAEIVHAGPQVGSQFSVLRSYLMMNAEGNSQFPFGGLKPAFLAARNGSAEAEPLQTDL